MNTIQVQGFDSNISALGKIYNPEIEICYSPDRQFMVIQNIWQKINHLVFYYINKHNKIFVVRMTITFPASEDIYPSWDHIRNFSKNMCRYFKDYYKYNLDPKYIWVREKSPFNIHQHYHFVLFVNGSLIQQPYAVTQKAIDLWGTALGLNATGLVNYDDSISVRRNESDYLKQLQVLFYMIQYIAKPLTKLGIEDGSRNFGCSRVPNNFNK